MSTPPIAPPPEAPSPEPPAPSSAATTPPVAAPVFPTPGESIISLLTGSTYEIGRPIQGGSRHCLRLRRRLEQPTRWRVARTFNPRRFWVPDPLVLGVRV
jgi:hypothetical protein